MKNRRIPVLLKVKNSLGPLENEVMQIVWDKDKVSVSSVTTIIGNNRPVAYTTIMTIMDTLYKKGFLIRKKVGKAYQYQAIASKNNFSNQALSFIINDLIVNYGRTKITIVALGLNRFFVIGYGMGFTSLTIFLVFSIWELFQNFQFSGTTQYINFLFIEPVLAYERFGFVFLAIIESLPLINILTTAIFTVFFIVFGKRLYKIFDKNIVQLGELV